jgi:hypothetical protein
MVNLLLGAALVGATAVAFRAALPVDGKMRSWITPKIEPYVAIVFLAVATTGFGLMLLGAISFFG